MGTPYKLEKVADKLPALVAKHGVAFVAAKHKVSTTAIYNRLAKAGKPVKKKNGKNGKTKTG